jgi:hypothetical protein
VAFFYIFVSQIYHMAILNNPKAIKVAPSGMAAPKTTMSTKAKMPSAVSAPNDLMDRGKKKKKKKGGSSSGRSTNKKTGLLGGGCRGGGAMPGGRR